MTPVFPNPMGRVLVQVQAAHYCAGLVIGRKTRTSSVYVLEAAPILRWALGKSWLETKAYFTRKGYGVTFIADPEALLAAAGTSGEAIRKMNGL